jgi:hypothetical protein
MLPPLLYTWKFCTNAISYVSFSGTQKLTIDAIIQGGYSADNMWETIEILPPSHKYLHVSFPEESNLFKFDQIYTKIY